jgi:hypothetical protein
MKCSFPHSKCHTSNGSNGGGISWLWFVHLQLFQQSPPRSFYWICYSHFTNHVNLCAFYKTLDCICLWKFLSLSTKAHDLLPIYQPFWSCQHVTSMSTFRRSINLLPLYRPSKDVDLLPFCQTKRSWPTTPLLTF